MVIPSRAASGFAAYRSRSADRRVPAACVHSRRARLPSARRDPDFQLVSLRLRKMNAYTGVLTVTAQTDHRTASRCSRNQATTCSPVSAAAGVFPAATVYEWTWAGLALHADRLDPATARSLLDVVIFYGPVATGTTTA